MIEGVDLGCTDTSPELDFNFCFSSRDVYGMQQWKEHFKPALHFRRMRCWNRGDIDGLVQNRIEVTGQTVHQTRRIRGISAEFQFDGPGIINILQPKHPSDHRVNRAVNGLLGWEKVKTGCGGANTVWFDSFTTNDVSSFLGSL